MIYIIRLSISMCFIFASVLGFTQTRPTGTKGPFKNEDFRQTVKQEALIVSGIQGRWKECFKMDPTPTDNLNTLSGQILLFDTLKQVTKTTKCEDALDSSYSFSSEAICILTPDIAEKLHQFIGNRQTRSYYLFYSNATDGMSASEVDTLLGFYRKLYDQYKKQAKPDSSADNSK